MRRSSPGGADLSGADRPGGGRRPCPVGPDQSDLDQKLAALEAKTSRQLVVVTLPSLQGYEISDYGYQLGRAWGIGQAKLNNGVLFIVAPNEHKVRIEVGYGLEPILTDALVGNDHPAGGSAAISAPAISMAASRPGVAALIQQLSLDPSAAEAKAAAAAQQVQHQGGERRHRFPILIIIIFIAIALRPHLWRRGFLAAAVSGRHGRRRRRVWRI